MDHQTAGELSTRVLDAVAEAVISDRDFLETLLTGILARGHVLLEDVPGTGKTLTAHSFADALNLDFQRIQFTPDLLPSDITGSNVYNEAAGTFEFSEGPIFANVVLADEINRAPPKTQAALLEAMGEKQVTVDGTTHDLPEPFFVIATQNPVEQEGTFGLPEAQRDRFIVKTAMGYPDRGGERELLDRRADRVTQSPSVDPVVDAERLAQLQRVPETVAVDERLRDYIVALGRATREDRRVEVGVSPRGIQRLFEAARAVAVLRGRDYVVPDDIKWVVAPVFTHRLVLTADAGVRGTDRSEIVADVLDSVEVPAVSGDDAAGQRHGGRQQRSQQAGTGSQPRNDGHGGSERGNGGQPRPPDGGGNQPRPPEQQGSKRRDGGQ
jgi:MoxR-like ATPase